MIADPLFHKSRALGLLFSNISLLLLLLLLSIQVNLPGLRTILMEAFGWQSSVQLTGACNKPYRRDPTAHPALAFIYMTPYALATKAMRKWSR